MYLKPVCRHGGHAVVLIALVYLDRISNMMRESLNFVDLKSFGSKVGRGRAQEEIKSDARNHMTPYRLEARLSEAVLLSLPPGLQKGLRGVRLQVDVTGQWDSKYAQPFKSTSGAKLIVTSAHEALTKRGLELVPQVIEEEAVDLSHIRLFSRSTFEPKTRPATW